MHMMKANSTSVVKVDSLLYIKPLQTKKHNNVVKSLEEWASRILYQDNNDYVEKIMNSDEETKRRFKRTKNLATKKYAMKDTSYKPNKDHSSESVDIGNFTPE
jgi:hypothetical protein